MTKTLKTNCMVVFDIVLLAICIALLFINPNDALETITSPAFDTARKIVGIILILCGVSVYRNTMKILNGEKLLVNLVLGGASYAAILHWITYV